MGTTISVAYHVYGDAYHRNFPNIGLREPDDLPKKGGRMVLDGEEWWFGHVEWLASGVLKVYCTKKKPRVWPAWLGI